MLEFSIRITSIEWSDNLSDESSSKFKETAKTIQDSVFEITVYESYKYIKTAKYPFPWWKTKNPICLIRPLVNVNVTAGCLWLHAYLNVLHRRMFFSFFILQLGNFAIQSFRGVNPGGDGGRRVPLILVSGGRISNYPPTFYNV